MRNSVSYRKPLKRYCKMKIHKPNKENKKKTRI